MSRIARGNLALCFVIAAATWVGIARADDSLDGALVYLRYGDAEATKFHGAFLDIDAKADQRKRRNVLISENLMLTKGADRSYFRWKLEIEGDYYYIKYFGKNNEEKFRDAYLDIDGKADQRKHGNVLISKNLMLTKGPKRKYFRWKITKAGNYHFIQYYGSDDEKKFRGAYLDIDGKADQKKHGEYLISRNIMLTKGPRKRYFRWVVQKK